MIFEFENFKNQFITRKSAGRLALLILFATMLLLSGCSEKEKKEKETQLLKSNYGSWSAVAEKPSPEGEQTADNYRQREQISRHFKSVAEKISDALVFYDIEEIEYRLYKREQTELPLAFIKTTEPGAAYGLLTFLNGGTPAESSEGLYRVKDYRMLPAEEALFIFRADQKQLQGFLKKAGLSAAIERISEITARTDRFPNFDYKAGTTVYYQQKYLRVLKSCIDSESTYGPGSRLYICRNKGAASQFKRLFEQIRQNDVYRVKKDKPLEIEKMTASNKKNKIEVERFFFKSGRSDYDGAYRYGDYIYGFRNFPAVKAGRAVVNQIERSFL